MAIQLLTSGLPVLGIGGASGLGHWTQERIWNPAFSRQKCLAFCSRFSNVWYFLKRIFSHFLCDSGSNFWSLFWSPKWALDLGISIGNVLTGPNLVPILGPILGPIFGPQNQQIFGSLVDFVAKNLGPMLGCLGLAVRFSLICNGQRWQDPRLTESHFSSTWMRLCSSSITAS